MAQEGQVLGAGQACGAPRFCSQCGAALSAGARFCAACGAMVGAVLPEGAPGVSGAVPGAGVAPGGGGVPMASRMGVVRRLDWRRINVWAGGVVFALLFLCTGLPAAIFAWGAPSEECVAALVTEAFKREVLRGKAIALEPVSVEQTGESRYAVGIRVQAPGRAVSARTLEVEAKFAQAWPYLPPKVSLLSSHVED